MEEYKGCEALDAGLLAAAQAVEHYEISRYGTLKQWAMQLGMEDAVRLLDETLQQEKKTDVALTTLAETHPSSMRPLSTLFSTFTVVPAQAGTHIPERAWSRCVDSVGLFRWNKCHPKHRRHGVWVPACAGTTVRAC
jgi:hypothetical protein